MFQLFDTELLTHSLPKEFKLVCWRGFSAACVDTGQFSATQLSHVYDCE